MALPFLPMTLECGSTDVSSKVVKIAVSESLYAPLRVDVTLQLAEGDPKAYLDEFFTLTLLDKTKVAEHKRHYMLHGKTEYVVRVTQERREWKRAPNGERVVRVHLTMESPLALLRNGQTFQIFFEKKLDEIFKAVLDEYKSLFSGSKSISTNVSKLPSFKPEYQVQYKEGDLDFLLRLCQENGVGFTQIGTKLEFAGGDKLISGSKREVEYDGFSSWERVDAQLGRNVTSRNLKPGEPLSKLFTAEKGVGKPKTTVHQVETFLDEKSGVGGGTEFVQVMTERIAHEGHGYVLRAAYDWDKKSGVFSPCVGLRVGELVPGPPKEAENETFLIEEVNWSFMRESEEQVYNFEAVIRSNETPYAPPRTMERPRENGLLRAIVIEPRSASKVDTDAKLGRVKVHFLWDKEDESTRSSRTCWVRLMTSYAGKKHGMYVMPEVGDEVLVAFEGGELHRPVVVGSLHNRESEVVKELTGSAALQLETLAFNTPKGIKARIWEKEGTGTPQQKVTLDLTDKIKLGLFSEQEVDINGYSEGTAQLLAKKAITVTSEESIELICGDSKMKMLKDGTITIEGKDITIKGTNITNTASDAIETKGKTVTVKADMDHKLSGNNVKVTANANADIAANANASVKAKAKAVLEGTAGVEVKSAATAKVSANATAELSSSGVAILKGSLVKIN